VTCAALSHHTLHTRTHAQALVLACARLSPIHAAAAAPAAAAIGASDTCADAAPAQDKHVYGSLAWCAAFADACSLSLPALLYYLVLRYGDDALTNYLSLDVTEQVSTSSVTVTCTLVLRSFGLADAAAAGHSGVQTSFCAMRTADV
jgi:hypothetical protein